MSVLSPYTYTYDDKNYDKRRREGFDDFDDYDETDTDPIDKVGV